MRMAQARSTSGAQLSCTRLPAERMFALSRHRTHEPEGRSPVPCQAMSLAAGLAAGAHQPAYLSYAVCLCGLVQCVTLALVGSPGARNTSLDLLFPVEAWKCSLRPSSTMTADRLFGSGTTARDMCFRTVIYSGGPN
jgi:hypothetical protein